MYRTLVHSRTDYNIMVFGTFSQNRQKKLEVTQNSLMRIILGAVQYTPIKEMLLELKLKPLATRKN